MLTQSRSDEPLSVLGLRSRGVITISFPDHSILKQEVARVIPLWKAFCALPLKVKKEFPYTHDIKVSGVGYESPGPGRDPKEDFHLRWSEREWLLGHAHRIGDPDIIRFVEAALSLGKHIIPLVSDFAQSVENEFDAREFVHDVNVCKDKALLRFLHYLPGGEVDDIIAKPHVDKGGFTAHLFEDREGIEFLTLAKRWESMPVPPGETTIIGGMRLQHRLKGQVVGACHRVVATEETVRLGRYSAVCFVDFNGTPYHDKETWGPTQNYEPGEFYGAPHEEFDKYFIP